METHFRTCNLCEAMCGLKITYANNEIIKIEGDQEDAFSRGHICPKANGLKDIYLDPDRLKFPIKKTENGWERISWEAAYEMVVSKTKEIQEKYGRDAVGIYQGNPTIHNLGTTMFAPDFFKLIKTHNMFTATSTDQLPHHFASWLMYGHPMLLPVPDIDHTDYMLIIGGNPLASNGSMMSVPDVAKRLEAIKSKSGKYVVIDPRKTETAKQASEHLFIKPNSDAYFLLAFLKCILENNPSKTFPEYIEKIEELKNSVLNFNLEEIEDLTGISMEKIQILAKEFSDAPSAVCYGRVGVSTQAFGGICLWLINVINIVSGNLDKKGGAMFTLPAIDFVGPAKPKDRFARWKSRVSGYPEFLGELPVAALAEEMLTEGQGQIKMMFTNCGNPVLSTSNGIQLDKAFESLEFMVSFDIYLNETTRHADLILPPATGLENPHYDLTFHNLAVRNTSKYSPPLFEKTEGAKYDWEIFQDLRNVFIGENQSVIPPEFKLDLGLKYGPYKLSMEKLKENPHGIDLGDLKPLLPERLKQKINLCPELLADDLKRLEESKTEMLNSSQNTFWMIGRRHLRDNNSWMHNSAKLMKGKNRCTLLINPDDANRLAIPENALVTVKSRVGEVQLPVEISEDIMSGVVSIPHGYGHNRKGTKMSIAEKYPGVSLNDLSDEKVIDKLTGNSAFSALRVSVSI
ncbi:molybdopterin oxidoreductase family protein [Lacihabitans sp. LS3-19]|uniref:molybdopterin-dependent oxidoreductase n=1 Tax=Lacihabitans sp. LS3-19 TaxID=2487335 RepID=UPI0020CF5B13|nr:molybdopterin-dependent oxidoreductase [Lacihabitans sp. LS3-19]MCP9766346.1 molybdopterin oxidoreductase family protein [Lacihabitans sp. LS3-19]